MSKWIFVTGGVASSLGKGVSGASIGKLMQLNGFSVTMAKFDPYFNVDPGTMNPYQHGEVYVASDGAETDLDLGYYERFLGIRTTKANTNTSGDIYKTVIEREIKGYYKGNTVQVIPHITDEIKRRFRIFEDMVDVAIIEIGGTVGDIEGLPFLEAIRQFRQEHPRNDVLCVHLTLVPFIGAAGELKTKPTQHSVSKLRDAGIIPDIIICRTEKHIDDAIKKKIALFCNVKKEAVIEASDCPSVYHIPELFHRQNVDGIVMKLFGLEPKKPLDTAWFSAVEKTDGNGCAHIGIIGKYTGMKDAYKSISESLHIAGIEKGIKIKEEYLDSEDPALESKISALDGIIIPGGYGYRGVEGKISAIKYAREHGLPFFGICLGMQCCVIEAARNMAGIKDATSSEFDPEAANPVIAMLDEQKAVTKIGGTQRCGEYSAKLKEGSLAHRLYGSPDITERHRHRYEFNPEYVETLEKAGLKVSAYHAGFLPEIVEIENHPFFIGVQFHPEFGCSIGKPNPIFAGFVEAAALLRREKAEADGAR